MTRIRTGDSEIWYGGCAIFNRIYSPVICTIFRFEVCANSNLQTHEFSTDYSAYETEAFRRGGHKPFLYSPLSTSLVVLNLSPMSASYKHKLHYKELHEYKLCNYILSKIHNYKLLLVKSIRCFSPLVFA